MHQRVSSESLFIKSPLTSLVGAQLPALICPHKGATRPALGEQKALLVLLRGPGPLDPAGVIKAKDPTAL